METAIREFADLPPLTLPRGRVADLVGDLRAEIVTGAISPGATLVQEDLASRFRVNRMHVREAIKHLQMLGFLTVEDNKRARVAELSRTDFIEIYDMREAAEALAMRCAMSQLSNAQIDAAAAIQDQIESVDAKEFGARNMSFHMALYRPSGRNRLLTHVEMLFNAAARYVAMVSSGPELKAKSRAEHHALLEHCLARDTNAAVACVETHIADARDTLVHYF